MLPPKAVLTRNFFVPLSTDILAHWLHYRSSRLPENQVAGSNVDDFHHKPHLNPKRLKGHLRRVRVPKYTKWGQYHNKRNGGLFSHPTWSKRISTTLPSPQTLKSASKHQSVTLPQTRHLKIFQTALRLLTLTRKNISKDIRAEQPQPY
jgi:hypothetical protein